MKGCFTKSKQGDVQNNIALCPPVLTGCTERNVDGKVLDTVSAVAMQLLKHLFEARRTLDIRLNIFNFWLTWCDPGVIMYCL